MAERPVNNGGFTLIEVLVAFAILAFTLATAYNVFSDASRAVALGERHGVALAVAEARLAEIDVAPADAPWDGEGEFDGLYRWRVESRALGAEAAGNVGVEPVAVTVTVAWDTGGPVTLETIRLRAR